MTGSDLLDAAADDERRRRLWLTFVFGCIGATALAAIAFVLSSPVQHTPHGQGALLLTEVPTAGATASASRTATPSRSRSASPSRPPTPHRSTPHPSSRPPTSSPTTSGVAARPVAPPPPRGAPCSGAPCAVPGTGGLPAALAAYRQAHGRSAVPVVAGAAAQQCAVTAGDGAACTSPYAIALETEQSGARAVADIASGQGNWLADPGVGSVEVGWAYQPATGRYVCALLERG